MSDSTSLSGARFGRPLSAFRDQVRLTMHNRLIASIFGFAVAVLGAMALGAFVDDLLTTEDVPTLAITGCVALAGVLSIVQLIRIWSTK